MVKHLIALWESFDIIWNIYMHSMQRSHAWKMQSLRVRGTILPSEVTWPACLSFLKLVPALKEATHSQSVVEEAYKD